MNRVRLLVLNAALGPLDYRLADGQVDRVGHGGGAGQDPAADGLERAVRQIRGGGEYSEPRKSIEVFTSQNPVEDLEHVNRGGQHQKVDRQTENPGDGKGSDEWSRYGAGRRDRG